LEEEGKKIQVLRLQEKDCDLAVHEVSEFLCLLRGLLERKENERALRHLCPALRCHVWTRRAAGDEPRLQVQHVFARLVG
jgi:hypothetical protein